MPKTNGAEVLGTIYDRFRRQADWKLQDDSTPEARNDRKQFIAASLEVLGACRVPSAEFERLYRRAMVSRARARANGESVNYKLSAEDLATEWFVLQKEDAAPPEDANVATDLCRNKNLHIGDESSVEYCFGGTVDVVLPCQDCRPVAFAQRKSEFMAKHNNSFANRRLTAGTDEEIEKYERINKPPKVYVNLKNPVEILSCWSKEIAAQMVKAVEPERKEVLRGFWLTTINALKYVKESDAR